MAQVSVIGAEVTVTGTLICTGDVSVDGTVRGDIRSMGTVLVSEGGKIFGNLYAARATIRGSVEGGVHATNVQLGSSSRVKGDVVQARIAVEDGAFFDGTCRHAENPLADAPKS
jgi:cytoskeletal protein CcmA (bactofilin family)